MSGHPAFGYPYGDSALGSAGETMHQVLDANLIAALKGCAIGIPVAVRNRGMTILVTVFDAGRTMVLIILTRTFDAFMEAFPLHSL